MALKLLPINPHNYLVCYLVEKILKTLSQFKIEINNRMIPVALVIHTRFNWKT